MKIEAYHPGRPADEGARQELTTFLHRHLGRYGDPAPYIRKAIDYALDPARGGQVRVAQGESGTLGAVVINQTHMEGYIPGNILVYIAVDATQRGRGIGRQLMQEAMAACTGGIALHVEPDNPAKKLYESLGFTNKYLEMRLQQ